MRCFIIGDDAADSRLTDVLASTARHALPAAILTSTAALSAAREAGDEAIIIVPDLGDGTAGDQAIALSREIDGGLVLLVADQLDSSLYKRLVRSGSGDWTTWDGFDDELTEQVRLRSDGPATDRGAKFVSLLPSKGGVGNTSLAIEVASRLSDRAKKGGPRAALIDLNLQGGSLAPALDVQCRLDLLEVSENPSRLDEKLVDVFTSRYSPRLDVFASPSRQIDLAAIDPAAIFGTIDIVAARYDLLLFDLPHAWAPWVDTLLNGSDLLLITGGGSVPALRQLAAKLSSLDALDLPANRTVVVVNECETTLLGQIKRRAEIERALPNRCLFLLPRDDAAATLAADSGRPIAEVASNTRLSRSIGVLTDWMETSLGFAQRRAGGRRMFGKSA